jgi:1-acyl-sn-glycerol-3-phosphate acyltransferase
VILVANHVSFVDWMIVMAAVRRPVFFVMWYTYYELPLVRFLFREAGVIPISSAKVRPKILERAMNSIRDHLQQGDALCIFPEGKITKTGEMNPFRPGVERMVEDNPVPVVPMALRGLWGSNFSRRPGSFWKRFLYRPLRSNIQVVIGEPIPPDEVTAELLAQRVAQLRGDHL